MLRDLSVIIIARNEAAAIGDCLASVAFAGEVIVVDSGSDDDTVAIARAYGARVEIRTDWPGFGAQKNRALDLVTRPWVLSLDADEAVSPALREEIGSALSAPGSVAAWRMPRESYYCGRILRHGGWWPDYVTRLFRRGNARFSPDLVHERLVVDGPVSTLASPLRHDTYRDLEEVLDKVNAYSSAGADQAYGRGQRASLATAVVHGVWAFLRTYVLRAGFRDGARGLLLAVSNAEATYYRYAKLWLLANTEDSATRRREPPR